MHIHDTYTPKTVLKCCKNDEKGWNFRNQQNDRWMDRRTDKGTEGQIDRPADGRMEGLTDRPTDRLKPLELPEI